MIDALEHRGEVIGLDHGMAQIRMQRASGCAGCGSRGTCASGQASAQIIQMHLSGSPRVGDQITISMPQSSIALAALLGYLLPPVGLLLGAVIAAGSFDGDAAAVLGAGLGFVAGLLLARLISHFTFDRGLAPSVCNHGFPPAFKPDSPSGEHS